MQIRAAVRCRRHRSAWPSSERQVAAGAGAPVEPCVHRCRGCPGKAAVGVVCGSLEELELHGPAQCGQCWPETRRGGEPDAEVAPGQRARGVSLGVGGFPGWTEAKGRGRQPGLQAPRPAWWSAGGQRGGPSLVAAVSPARWRRAHGAWAGRGGPTSRRGQPWAKARSLWGPAQGTCWLGATGTRLQPSSGPLTTRLGPASARGPQLGFGFWPLAFQPAMTLLRLHVPCEGRPQPVALRRSCPKGLDKMRRREGAGRLSGPLAEEGGSTPSGLQRTKAGPGQIPAPPRSLP